MSELRFMRLALRLARRSYGLTSPNPMVGAVLVKGGRVIGRGWHRRAGLPHAEIEALMDARKHHHNPRGAAMYVTLEPCSTHGRTPPCTQALIAAGIRQVIAGATDPNPKHAGQGFKILKKAGVETTLLATRPAGSDRQLADDCASLNEAFNHWIVRRMPFVTVKSAMTLDGKIATPTGESKWITGAAARAYGMKLRLGSDAILVGVNTLLADDPSLTVRTKTAKPLRRIVLDSRARTPLTAKIISDSQAALTTIVVGAKAPKARVTALAERVTVLVAPYDRAGPAQSRKRQHPSLDLRWLLRKFGAENITSLLVEGGGEVNASFFARELAQRVAFFYAPKILGGRQARKAVAGAGAGRWSEVGELCRVKWRRLGPDLLLEARIQAGRKAKS